MRLFVKTGVLALCCLAASPARADEGAPPPTEDLSNLSIEQLANLQVRSASKRSEPLSAAPAAIYVIDHDQIVRSHALTIPEMLRLAPNLQVYQSSPSNWIVTARGLNGRPSAQSFSNKLLVLIDGRTIYTPLFSGVYWDLPDLVPDDIDHIEVISGPGATLWGANAVNGVINIITRRAASGSGAFVDIDAGTQEQVVGARLAGTAGPNVSYRLFGRWLHEHAFDLPSGGTADDGWHRLGGGFRTDWTPTPQDLVTAQGDLFRGREDLPGGHERVTGDDLVLRWTRDMRPDQQLQVEAFYDRIERGETPSSPEFHVDTYDLDVQHSFALGGENQIVWGGGARIAHYNVEFTTSFFFAPPSRNLFLANLFVQDTWKLSHALSVTGGLKAERDPYAGVSLLPDVRFAFTPSVSTLLWAAASHAVRSPTPFDEDAQERVLGGFLALSGNRDFRTEKLTAYEVGLRAQPLAALSFSLTGFYHLYDDLRTVDLGSGPAVLNLYWGNGLAGHTYGLEAWANYSPVAWWTLSAGATLMHEKFHFKPGPALQALGTAQNDVDPGHYLTARSSMSLGSSVTFDVDLRAVGQLNRSAVPAYAELGGRISWNVSDRLALTLAGTNLLHARHVEYPGGDAIPRTILAGLQWRR